MSRMWYIHGSVREDKRERRCRGKKVSRMMTCAREGSTLPYLWRSPRSEYQACWWSLHRPLTHEEQKDGSHSGDSEKGERRLENTQKYREKVPTIHLDDTFDRLNDMTLYRNSGVLAGAWGSGAPR